MHITKIQLVVAVSVVSLIAISGGFCLGKVGFPRRGDKAFPYYDARNTASRAVGVNPGRRGSQELALLSGKVAVKVYSVIDGEKKMLHAVSFESANFHSVFFSLIGTTDDGSIAAPETTVLAVTAQSILSSLEGDGHPRYSEGDYFYHEWRYDLGRFKSVYALCNSHVTTEMGWKPGADTPVIGYQISRLHEDGSFYMESNDQGILFTHGISEAAMLHNSKVVKGLEFVLITAAVVSEP